MEYLQASHCNSIQLQGSSNESVQWCPDNALQNIEYRESSPSFGDTEYSAIRQKEMPGVGGYGEYLTD